MNKEVFLTICMLLIVSVVKSQECDPMFRQANEYFLAKEYKLAISQCQVILSSNRCKESMGDDVRKMIEKCNEKIEEEDFKHCKSITACNLYLEKHPKGKHIAQVRTILAEKKAAVELANNANEDALFKECTTISACDEYLKKFPQGKHVVEVRSKKEVLELIRDEAEEDEAYSKCTTLEGCENYLKTYPSGRYYSTVLKKRRAKSEQFLGAEDKAYMDVQTIEFANVDDLRSYLDGFGFTMYASDIKYLIPRITYDGLVDELKFVSLDCRIVNPDGSIQSYSGSPIGYTYSKSFWVKPGLANTCLLAPWGNSEGGVFEPGTYGLEIWYEGKLVHETHFTVLEKRNSLTQGGWRNAFRYCNSNRTVDCGNGTYKGEFMDGKRDGLGMYLWNNGFSHIGQWHSNSPSGVGIQMASEDNRHYIYNCPDCAYCVGEWSGGKKDGIGNCYNWFGEAIYHGAFYDDQPEQSYPMSGLDSYKFECVEYDDGRYYVGETVNGIENGMGIIIWSNGDLWYGHFSEGERDGYGVFMPFDGSLSTGTWKGDIRQ